ncbi:MAG: membrane protein insertase YidC [Pseudomonadota bacterium]
MDTQRILLFVALSFVLLLMWQAWVEDQAKLAPPPVVTMGVDGRPAPAADVPSAVPAGALPDAPGAAPVAAAVPGETFVRVVTDVLDVRVNTRGGTLASADLLSYPVSLEKPDEPFRLLDDRAGRQFMVQSGLRSASGLAPDHYAQYLSAQSEYHLAQGQDELIVPLTWNENGLQVTKTLRFKRGSYAVEIGHTVENRSETPWNGSEYRQLQRIMPDDGHALVYTYTGGVYAGDVPGSEERVPYEKVELSSMAKNPLSRDLTGGWVAMIQHYFLAAWVPPQTDTSRFYTLVTTSGTPLYSLGVMSPARNVMPGETAQFSSTLYVGPKIQEDLEPLAEGLDLTVDYGMFTVIAQPIFWLLKFFHEWLGNWGWAIVMVTVVIKLIFYWPSAVSYRSMANMRKLTPKLQALKERYGENRQKLSEEMMKLYRTEKINPLGGCLPILIQIPVFISLYWVLVESVELRQAPWVLWIDDLSRMDPYYVLPVLMGITMWIQQKLNPQPVDPMQQKVFMFLPFIFTVFFAFFPAGLVLYWLVNNVLSIAQQWFITRRIEKAAA